jgi:DNA-binding Lrp family transcriptional regulator
VKTRQLDQIDLKILIELQRNGRITNQRLSELVGLSPRPCLERVRRLEESGLIRQYMALIALELLPGVVTAFAEITLKNQSTQASAFFEERVRQCPEVVQCFLVGGRFDYIAQIACANLERYNELTSGWIDDPELPVARIVSNFVLKPVVRFAGYPLAAGLAEVPRNRRLLSQR